MEFELKLMFEKRFNIEYVFQYEKTLIEYFNNSMFMNFNDISQYNKVIFDIDKYAIYNEMSISEFKTLSEVLNYCLPLFKITILNRLKEKIHLFFTGIIFNSLDRSIEFVIDYTNTYKKQ